MLVSNQFPSDASGTILYEIYTYAMQNKLLLSFYLIRRVFVVNNLMVFAKEINSIKAKKGKDLQVLASSANKSWNKKLCCAEKIRWDGENVWPLRSVERTHTTHLENRSFPLLCPKTTVALSGNLIYLIHRKTISHIVVIIIIIIRVYGRLWSCEVANGMSGTTQVFALKRHRLS